MEKYEKIEYDYIDSIGQWKTATVYELIEWDEPKISLFDKIMDKALIAMEWALYALLTVPLLIVILLNLLNNY